MRKIFAEGLGTALLLSTIVGSGIMAANLAGGNMAIALLGNTIPTGAILVVLISTLGRISGAHFNPLVSLAALVNRTMPTKEAVVYVAVQFIGALLGIIIAHAMFDLPLLQASTTMRSDVAQWFAEVVASFGLLTVIFLSVRNVPQQVASMSVFTSRPPIGSPHRQVLSIPPSHWRVHFPILSQGSGPKMFWVLSLPKYQALPWLSRQTAWFGVQRNESKARASATLAGWRP